jgi:hypothetical protein
MNFHHFFFKETLFAIVFLISFCAFANFNWVCLVRMAEFLPIPTHEKLLTTYKEFCDGRIITQINLANAGFTEFPMELLRYKDTLEFINFGGNKLSSLPPEIAQFQKLRILFFAENYFTEIPVELGQLPQLYMLSFKTIN